MKQQGSLTFMNRLVINTANTQLDIVLEHNGKVESKSISSVMHHNETMLPEIDALLKQNNMSITDVEEFGVVVGPGSFTGIRVGIATIKAFRDSLGAKAKGINNLHLLFKCAKRSCADVETVAILGSKDSYFVAKLINGIVYTYERNLTLSELNEVAEGKPVGMYELDANVNCFKVDVLPEVMLECLSESEDELLIPVYYQLSQAENEKLKRVEAEILPMQEKDLTLVAELETEAVVFGAFSFESLKGMWANTNYKCFVLKIGEELAGYIVLQLTDEVNVISVAVKKEFRNLGFGTKLLETAKNCALENKINTLSLEVSAKNVTAYLLYKKFGFVVRRVRKNYYGGNNDCFEMELKF